MSTGRKPFVVIPLDRAAYSKCGTCEGRGYIATEPAAWALRFSGDPRLNLSTIFDTEGEAQQYAERCVGSGAEVVPLYTRPQAAISG